ncbi:hypothetical protein NliqN6_1935 [Naganishia liquefaciens]|uniref:Uncharacterized protein n=1 Tax=Naganishia liquefaciens TaxID=104408 RepID=A0A8H3TRG0_9TREE|nr:hypothetical protein NliqN6_1935 [Naganishia liquefaciens]
MSSTSVSSLFIQPTDTRTATASQVATSGVVEDDPLSNPDASKIVKVTIACAIMVLVVTGAVAGFKIARLIRSRREYQRRKIVARIIEAGGETPGWMTQHTRRKWQGRKLHNAHRQLEWEGTAA